MKKAVVVEFTVMDAVRTLKNEIAYCRRNPEDVLHNLSVRMAVEGLIAYYKENL